ncbi:MAG: SDR family NAD(P)-dependent oxidoreductase [Halioglobus sp.]|jgi:NAD(P)-dependent dehydrogenase (short-subunit alcohol dehydrogenase family)|uniref:SDR family oxidoreductase n=1 Tax=Candidatus Seongchinamella marina TaxID=2518990 RepID=A0ABT3SQY1_9GAMM|nr:SDR family NAD(P)-dependent oxidoreductase [Candidatus Seongchinamella marina]EEB80176.1 oxidoreductase, short chain dehydrogenase/reductase family [marine gamma proteobacterium HTCC2148]MBT6125170.1 SDR family oxidoreductase [Halieaceae bacterium]MDG1388937.1 SDR family NAD(P)-dependent oxidoreductase [Halioglobus sp.]MBT7719137.1 SDR family oxidoreductase [Halieaceae bacterium]MCX2972373.1 SDR family oxidoreductase [Candidatus Seongchinamella marina]
MDLGLAGKNAVITGSTRGIGRAIANLLADEGTNLAICSRNQEEVDSAVAELSAKGVKVTGAVVDVADKASYQAWIASVGEELGGIDIFVPNVSAGGGNMSEEGWEANFNIDLLGTTRGVEAAMPFLEKSSAASIVVISSTAGVETFMGPQPYNAIKGALVIHAKQLSQALAPAGIRVNCVSPGPIFIEGGAWEFIKENMTDLYDATLADIPSGRFGSAEEIANTVAFIASPAASLITGVNLVADGGFTKRVQL